MCWPADEVRAWARRADRVEDARIARLGVVMMRAFHDPGHLHELFYTPAWKRDRRSSTEIIASTLAAWGG